MKIKVEKEYPYRITEFKPNQIKDFGLKVIAEIESSEIQYDNQNLNTFFYTIEKECKDKHIWILFGSKDKKSWIPLQAGSKTKNVTEEIRNDFSCMFPYDEKKNKKSWNSCFYKSVMEIDYGLERKYQKYRQIKDMCKWLGIAIFVNESKLKDVNDGSGISKYQKAECDIAVKLKPLLWNPAPNSSTGQGERAYLKSKHNLVLQKVDLNNGKNRTN